MAFTSSVYRLVTRRFSTTFLAVAIGAVALDIFIDKGGNYIFEWYNKGKLWKDIKHKYVGEASFIE